MQIKNLKCTLLSRKVHFVQTLYKGPHYHFKIFFVPDRSLDPLDWVLFGGPSGPGGQGGSDRSGQPSATQIKTVRTIVPHPQRRSHMHLMENDLVLIELQVYCTLLGSTGTESSNKGKGKEPSFSNFQLYICFKLNC